MSVFDEPETLTEATVQNADSWLKTAGGEARAVRQVINEWYSNFSDRDTMVLSRLRGDSAVNLFQAIDELHVHKYLSQTCEPVYEEDQNSPDFRLYRSGRYLAGVEVATLFASQDFDNENSRNAELTAVINTQVLSESWLLHYTVVEWHGSPSPKRIAEWAPQKIDALPGPRPDLTAEEYPTAEYRVDGVQLDFTFIPRTAPVDPTSHVSSVVGFGPIIVRWGKSDRRLRRVIAGKGGSRYDHKAAPFAVVVSIRDPLCDLEDAINALYGDETISIEIDNPGTAHATRKMNGVFALSSANSEGRNRRISCVFVLEASRWPSETMDSRLVRFDNPFAEHEFPDDLLVPDRHFEAVHDKGGVRMEWRE